MLLHELRDDAIERFLGEDRVAHLSIHATTEELEYIAERAEATGLLTRRSASAHHEGSAEARVHVVVVVGVAARSSAHTGRGDADVHHHLIEHLLDLLWLVLAGLWAVGVAREQVAAEVVGRGRCYRVGETWTAALADECSAAARLAFRWR